jgi:hypothetical protein
MRSSLLYLSVAALLVCSANAVPEAEARGGKGAKYEGGGQLTSVKRVGAGQQRGARRDSMTKVKTTKRPASCGTYMYWKEGRCQDARLKK